MPVGALEQKFFSERFGMVWTRALCGWIL